MKRLAAIFVTWLAGGLLAGCVPNAASYYGPSVADGQVVTRGHCVPLPTDVVFQVGTLPARTRVMEGYRSTYIAVRLGSDLMTTPDPKPSWQTFHFTSDRFLVHDLARNVGMTFDKVMNRDQSLPVTAPTIAPYWLEIHLPKPAPESFELISPPIVVDGQEYPFPPIKFERKLWVGISPFNC